jgi:hypothetical protein
MATSGAGTSWTGLAYRESILLRGLVFEQDEVVKLDASGRPVSFTIRGVTPSGDSAETFIVDQGIGRWKTSVDEGEAPAARGIYNTFGGTFLSGDATLPAYLKAGARSVDLLPSGHGTLEASGTSFQAIGPNGPETIRLYFLKGVGQSPAPVWLNNNGKLFGFYGGLALVPAGYEASLKPMIAEQEAGIADLAPAIAKRLLTAEARQPILFRNVKIYDADKERFVEGQNVVVANGKIVSVGTALPKLPAGARVIDGAGKTLVPGLWDSHMHVADDFNAPVKSHLGSPRRAIRAAA